MKPHRWEPDSPVEVALAPWSIAVRAGRLLVRVGLDGRYGLLYRWDDKRRVYTGLGGWVERGYLGPRLGFGWRWLW